MILLTSLFFATAQWPFCSAGFGACSGGCGRCKGSAFAGVLIESLQTNGFFVVSGEGRAERVRFMTPPT